MPNWRWHLNSWLVKCAVGLLRRTGWYDGYWNYWRAMFPYAESKGLHIVPCHYYSPVPVVRDLPDELWSGLRQPIGFDLGIDAALDQLEQLSNKYGREFGAFSRDRRADTHTYYLNNLAFQSGDAEILYAMLRDLKPRRVIEIGSGYSTLLICQALRANRLEASDYKCEFIAIEPFLPAFLAQLPEEVTRVERKPLQQVPSELFSSLQANDVLFIDSTHVVRIGSDVVHECLQVIPSVARGVVIHVHDIFIPAEYPRQWIDEARFFWNEQYLLEAFLNFNREFEVCMPVHAMWRLHPERFSKVLPTFEPGPNGPCSFWMRRVH